MCSSLATPAFLQAAARRRQVDVHARERVAAPLVQHAGEIDGGRHPAHVARERRVVVRISFDDLHGRQQQQMARTRAPARQHDDEMTGRRKLGNDVAADKAASADNQNARTPGRRAAARGGLAHGSFVAARPSAPRGVTTPRRSTSET